MASVLWQAKAHARQTQHLSALSHVLSSRGTFALEGFSGITWA